MRPTTPLVAAGEPPTAAAADATVGPPSQTSAEIAPLPASITASRHPSDDGRSHGVEVRAGSNPLSHKSSPRHRWVAPAVPGSVD